MLPPIFKVVIAGAICLLLSIFLGYSVATEDYTHFLLLCLIIGLTTAFIVPGYAGLLAFGLLFPFFPRIPLIYGFPWLGTMLGLCCVKYFFRGAVRKKEQLPLTPCMTPLIAVFFSWVVLRYCMNPVTPGIALGGDTVTGFRAYFTYALCGFVLVSLGLFLYDRSQFLQLIKWMVYISTALIFLLAPLTFTKSLTLASLLRDFGLYVTFFDNGWLRFVLLPHFGIILIIVAMLPNLLKFKFASRAAFFCIGMGAVIIGGNRGTFVGALIAILVVLVLKRRWVHVISGTVGIAMLLGLLYWIGEQATMTVGVLRVATLVSGKAANMTDAAQNVEWRMVRWERALQDVKTNPILGVGYGGLERAFVVDATNIKSALVELDVAAGSIHNGFISGARALGIPCAILFAWILISETFRSSLRSIRVANVDPQLSEAHIFISAMILPFMAFFYVSSDLNDIRFWFLIGVGIIARRIQPVQQNIPLATPSHKLQPIPIGRFLSPVSSR